MTGMGSFPSPSKVDQIVTEFFAKCLHVILESRIPFICSQAQIGRESPASSSASSSSLGLKSKDRWFNLVLSECPAAQESADLWRRNSSEPMIVDVLLVRSTGWGSSPGRVGTPDSWSGGDGEESSSSASASASYGTVLERWVISYERSGRGRSNSNSSSSSSLPHALEVPVIYKRAVILMRSLYCTVRTLPAHRLFHLANSSSHSRSFSLSYRVSTTAAPLDEATMSTRTLIPVDTPNGRLCISVAYRHTTAVTALEVTPPILPRIISDYVGSPTTDPLRKLSSDSVSGSVPSGGISGRRGVHVVSLPSSVPNSPSPQLSGRRHSWAGGGQPQQQQQQPVLMPPSSPSFKSSSSSSPHSHPHPHYYHPPPPHPPPLQPRAQSCPSGLQTQPSQPIPIHDRHWSPPLSPSPPGTSHSLESSLSRFIPRHASAPVTIPRPSSLRFNYLNPLPPPSPKRTNPDHHYHHHHHHQQQLQPYSNLSAAVPRPSISITMLAESLLPPHRIGVGEEKVDEDGPPSGVKRSLYASSRPSLSRSSSKLNCQDDVEEDEFACPFAVDDIEDSPVARNRSGNLFDGSSGHQHKSQHAAVGALMWLLKSASPLQFRNATGGESGGGDTGLLGSKGRPSPSSSPASPHHHHQYHHQQQQLQMKQQQQQQHGVVDVACCSSSSSSSPLKKKSVAEALDELKAYKEMREFLLRQCGRKCTDNNLLPSHSPPNVT